MDNYQPIFLIVFALIFFHTTCQSSYEGECDAAISRRKRAVVFPLGSTFSVSYRNSYCNDIRLDLLKFICTCSINQRTQGFNFY